jgi:hypothetical protein
LSFIDKALYPNVIKDLEDLCIQFENKLDIIEGSNRFRNDDVRLSFYYLTIQTIDAAIHLLIFNSKLEEDTAENDLKRSYMQFDIRVRSNKVGRRALPFEKICENHSQFIANSYLFSIYSTFEFCIRCVAKTINEEEYMRRKNFISLLDYVMSYSGNFTNFKKLHQENFIHYNKLRNVIHNNGVFFPTNLKYKESQESFTFPSGDTLIFKYGWPILGGNLWKLYVSMTREMLYVFDDVINTPCLDYVSDPSFIELL